MGRGDEMKKLDLTGQRFGRLVVIEEAPKLQGNRKRRWLCQCDCGKNIVVFHGNLRSGNTKSCGCTRGKKQIIHGKTRRKKGERKPRLYSIWDNMKQRCYNPNHTGYHLYGGRGITVCDEWKNDFQAFYDWAMANGYEDNLQIDRIDNDGNYEPRNCRWVTPIENSNNRRNNTMIEYKGYVRTISEWAKITGIPAGKISKRYRAGKPPEEIFKTKQ